MASLLTQSHLPNEVIVVASDPDESDAVRLLLEKLDFGQRAVCVASTERLTGGAARNLGWKAANSELIFFLDDDDYFSNEKLAQHVQEHITSSADVVYSSVWSVFSDGSMRVEKPVAPRSNMEESLLQNGVCPPTTSCVSVTKKALEQVEGFDQNLPSYQDWELWYRLANAGSKFSQISSPLTYFVQHDEARVSTNSDKRLFAAKSVLKKHGEPKLLSDFFDREKIYMERRRLLLAAQAGDLTAVVRSFRSSPTGRDISAISEHLRFWAKACIFYAMSKFGRKKAGLSRD